MISTWLRAFHWGFVAGETYVSPNVQLLTGQVTPAGALLFSSGTFLLPALFSFLQQFVHQCSHDIMMLSCTHICTWRHQFFHHNGNCSDSIFTLFSNNNVTTLGFSPDKQLPYISLVCKHYILSKLARCTWDKKAWSNMCDINAWSASRMLHLTM